MDPSSMPGDRTPVRPSGKWAYRFLGAAIAHHDEEPGAAGRAEALPPAGPLPPPEPTTAEVRAWARSVGIAVPDRGRLRPEVWAAFDDAHSGERGTMQR